MAKLKEYLVASIKPKEFYDDFFNQPAPIQWVEDGWTNLFCPFHNPLWKEQKGKSPSFGIHIASGAFRCQSPSCGAHGASLVNFYDQFHGLEFKRTLRRLYHQWVQPTISQKKIDAWAATLKDSPSIMRYITERRGLSKEAVARFQLGFDGSRITIPIYDQFGFAVDIRRYDFTGQAKVKILSYKKGYGTAKIFPLDNLTSTPGRALTLCEGEWDTMLATDHGYAAITITAGAGSWPVKSGPNDHTNHFKGRAVRIVYDVNDVDSQGALTDAGQIGAAKVAAILAPLARLVKIVKLPIKKSGGDITDWFMHYHKTAEELDEVIKSTPVHSKTDQQPATGAAAPVRPTVQLRLDEAADAAHYFKPIEMECLVSGKDLSPYLAPKKVKASIYDAEDESTTHEEFIINTEHNKHILGLINCTQGKLKSAIAENVGLKGEKASFETLETFNMEELRVIPSINLRDMDGAYAIRRAVYVGHGLESNRTYKMNGYTLPDPENQSCVHVITQATPVQDTVENFKLTTAVRDRLAEKFTPKDTATVDDQIAIIAGWLSRHVTHIKRRADLHTAIDLVFHSPMTFNFNGEEVTKGWLELLVIGDTRCGKGYVAERMSKFYRLGETVTGENCSFAGLIGGLQKNNDHWFVSWGKIPLNDKRLVVIDEGSAIPVEQIGKLSRVRSEGIAEIIKIITERTRARTRLIWLSNPRSGKPLNTYNHGVEAIPELFGNTEDVARLDLAMTVASSEVPSKLINSPQVEATDGDRFNPEDFTNLVLWAWSRKPEQVRFTPRATQMILDQAVIMGRAYSSSIPLIQAENVRVKLAKVSAAVAARCFSCDESGEELIIKSQHVRFAYEFINQLYSKPSMGYDVYSSTAINRSTLLDEEAVIKAIKGLKQYAEDFVDGMMERHAVTYEDVGDLAGVERLEAQILVGKLVRLRCLTKEDDRRYVKRPAFGTLLQIIQKSMKEDAHK